MDPYDSSASTDLVYLQSVCFSLTCLVWDEKTLTWRPLPGNAGPTTIMIVVWNPKDNITVKESAKNTKSVSPLEFEIFVRSLRILVCVVRFFRNAVQRGRIWKPLENTRVNSQFGIRRGLEWARPKNVLEAMVEQQKVKKNWCPTILKYNLLIYVVLVLKEKDTSEVKFCRSNFIFYVWKRNSLTTNSK